MRLGKFNIPLADIPKMVIRIAHDKGVNLNENFEITIQSSTNPELILTKSFHTLDQLTHFIVVQLTQVKIKNHTVWKISK